MIKDIHHERLIDAFSRFDKNMVESENPIFCLLKKVFYGDRVIGSAMGCYMPVPFPTGVGKTFNTILLIFHAILDDIKNQISEGDKYVPRYCYYITNSVDNVINTYCGLITAINESSFLNEIQKQLVCERVLYAPANSTSLIDLFDRKNGTIEKIKKLFSIDDKSSLGKELISIESEWETIKSIKLHPAQKKSLVDRHNYAASKCYSSLIGHIQKIQLGKNPVPLVNDNIELISELIPGVKVEIGRAKVIFMTTKKFLFGLQQSTGKHHPARNLSGNILIIDEVDRQHHEILTHLVAANDTDLLATLRTIHSNLKEQKLCTKPQYAGISELFNEYLDKVVELFDEWALQHSFDIHSSAVEDGKKVLLFSDKMTTHTTSLNKQLVVSFNDENQQHEISLRGSQKEREEHDFPKFLGRLERLVNREFQSVVRKAEEQYRENMARQMQTNNYNGLTSVQAIASILDQLNLHSLREQLNQQLSYLSGRKYSSRKSAANYHTRGIRMIEIDHLPESQDSVMFKHHGFNVTPTGMLASWVEAGCNILGISATAECESVIHNFDIRYLKESLGDGYVELNKEQKKDIYSFYGKERNYIKNGVAVNVHSISESPLFLHNLLKKWKPQSKDVYFLLRQLFNASDKEIEFGVTWLSKVCQSIDLFSKAKNNRYMVVMLNRGIKHPIDDFLDWYVNGLGRTEGIPIKLFPCVDTNFLKQGRFDSEIVEFLQSEAGKLVFITSYATMSSGKNPDYKFNADYENCSLRHVGLRHDDKTDIDFTYLEEPTNLISVSGNVDTRTSDRLLLLSYGMALQESGAIGLSQANYWCRDVVIHDSPVKVCQNLKIKFYGKETDDCLSAIYRMIEQAIGRSARTGMKRENIYIAADSDLVKLLANDSRDDTLFSHEYRALVCFSKSKIQARPSLVDKDTRRLQNLAVLHTARSLSAIEKTLNLINRAPTIKNIQLWIELRLSVLKCPASILPPTYREYYVMVPDSGAYVYSSPSAGNEWQSENYKFFFNCDDPIKKISEAAACLPTLMKNVIVKQYFDERGFCTSWPENAKYVLTPPMFINIYLGALGEEASKAILYQHGFDFESLPFDDFEKFDEIVVLNEKKALIDFKNWDLGAWRALSDEVKESKMHHIKNKLLKLGMGKLVICNLIGCSNDPVRFFDSEFNQINDELLATIISVPCLLDELDGEVKLDNIIALARWMLI